MREITAQVQFYRPCTLFGKCFGRQGGKIQFSEIFLVRKTADLTPPQVGNLGRTGFIFGDSNRVCRRKLLACAVVWKI